jgi:hypothetical protein
LLTTRIYPGSYSRKRELDIVRYLIERERLLNMGEDVSELSEARWDEVEFQKSDGFWHAGGGTTMPGIGVIGGLR